MEHKARLEVQFVVCRVVREYPELSVTEPVNTYCLGTVHKPEKELFLLICAIASNFNHTYFSMK